MDPRMKIINEAESFLRKKLGGIQPEIGVVLGSGLGKFGDQIEPIVTIPYKEIPNFVTSTAMGHKGNFIIGKVSGKYVCAMQGRFHYYEGYSMDVVTLPIRVMARLGIKTLIVSNAAGGVNTGFQVGDLMIIEDHINTMPNPLIGPNHEQFGERFPDMSCAYDQDMIAKAEAIARSLRIRVRRGVYLANTGPSYETPAEIRYYHMIGADAVGMSTVPEVIVARHCGLKVFGMSIITNEANSSINQIKINHGEDVIRIADKAADKMGKIVTRLIGEL
ncbi:MAG: purine nucleoside phosphorylase I, inosine and guanosine-specific [Bacteroidales bacterium]|nr:purine nucleoside phosphorylase I, inosine and guanosine-specific [Bacteroidales bacterium]